MADLAQGACRPGVAPPWGQHLPDLHFVCRQKEARLLGCYGAGFAQVLVGCKCCNETFGLNDWTLHVAGKPCHYDLLQVRQGDTAHLVPFTTWLRVASHHVGGSELKRRQLNVLWWTKDGNESTKAAAEGMSRAAAAFAARAPHAAAGGGGSGSGSSPTSDSAVHHFGGGVWRAATIRNYDPSTAAFELKYHDLPKRSKDYIWLPFAVCHFARNPPMANTPIRAVADGFAALPEVLLQQGAPGAPPPGAAPRAAPPPAAAPAAGSGAPAGRRCSSPAARAATQAAAGPHGAGEEHGSIFTTAAAASGSPDAPEAAEATGDSQAAGQAMDADVMAAASAPSTPVKRERDCAGGGGTGFTAAAPASPMAASGGGGGGSGGGDGPLLRFCLTRYSSGRSLRLPAASAPPSPMSTTAPGSPMSISSTGSPFAADPAAARAASVSSGMAGAPAQQHHLRQHHLHQLQQQQHQHVRTALSAGQQAFSVAWPGAAAAGGAGAGGDGGGCASDGGAAGGGAGRPGSAFARRSSFTACAPWGEPAAPAHGDAADSMLASIWEDLSGTEWPLAIKPSSSNSCPEQPWPPRSAPLQAPGPYAATPTPARPPSDSTASSRFPWAQGGMGLGQQHHQHYPHPQAPDAAPLLQVAAVTPEDGGDGDLTSLLLEWQSGEPDTHLPLPLVPHLPLLDELAPPPAAHVHPHHAAAQHAAQHARPGSPALEVWDALPPLKRRAVAAEHLARCS